MKPIIKIVLGLIAVGLFTTGSFAIVRGFSKAKDNFQASVHVTDISTEEDLFNINTYDGMVMTGAEAVDVIKRLQYSYQLVTHTPKASVVYPTEDYGVPNIKGSNSYLDPNIYFISTLNKDTNGTVLGLDITQVDMVDIPDTSVSAQSIKDIIGDIISDNGAKSQSWSEIANRITAVLETYRSDSSNSSAQLEFLEEQLLVAKTKYEEQLAKSTVLDLDAINREIEKAFDLPAGYVTLWQQGAEEMQKLVDLRNKMMDDIRDIESKLGDPSIQDSINSGNEELDTIMQRIAELTAEYNAAKDLYDHYYNESQNALNNSSSTSETAKKLREQYETLYAKLKDLLAQIEKLKAELADLQKQLSNAKILRDKNRGNYETQLTIANDWVNKYNVAKAEADNWINLYNKEVDKTNYVKVEAIRVRDDVNTSKDKLKVIMGGLYDGNKNLTGNITTAYDAYKEILRILDMSTGTTLAQFETNWRNSLNNASNAVIGVGGVILSNSLTGLANGILTIPQELPASGHVHTANCYPKAQPAHTHVNSCYYQEIIGTGVCGGTNDQAVYYTSWSCSSCSYSPTYSQGYSANSSPHYDGDTVCRGTLSSGSTIRKYRCGACGSESSSSGSCRSTVTNYRRTLICTLSEVATDTSVAICNTIPVEVFVMRMPTQTTPRGGAINTKGLAVMIKTLDGALKYTTNYTVSGLTNSTGPKTGTISVLKPPHGTTNAMTISKTFTYTVQ